MPPGKLNIKCRHCSRTSDFRLQTNLFTQDCRKSIINTLIESTLLQWGGGGKENGERKREKKKRKRKKGKKKNVTLSGSYEDLT